MKYPTFMELNSTSSEIELVGSHDSKFKPLSDVSKGMRMSHTVEPQ